MTHKTFYDLISAIKIGRSKDVGELLKKRANPNILGRALCEGEGCISALAIAIERGDAAMVELLLRYGANLHDIHFVYSAPAPIGATTSALHFLCGVQMHASNWCAIADLRADNLDMAEALDLWLASGFGDDASASMLLDAAYPSYTSPVGYD